ncbi:MAG TPA: divergent polysaccharide deacetylase family protein, partial [Terriglobia bacterium]|nr:divergent polysaccharide deacetylase family protein [Terriglobia bacterium]
NNHMGSQATADPVLMQAVMTVLASRHLFFIDSRTTAETVALDVARRTGVPAFYRSVFLDDSQNVNYTLGQLRQFCDAVKRQGAAIAIGHPYPTTLAALVRFLPEFDREEIELVPASRLARSPEFARLSPPHIHH